MHIKIQSLLLEQHPEALVMHILKDVLVDVRGMDVEVTASASVAGRADVLLLPFLGDGGYLVEVGVFLLGRCGFLEAEGRSGDGLFTEQRGWGVLGLWFHEEIVVVITCCFLTFFGLWFFDGILSSIFLVLLHPLLKITLGVFIRPRLIILDKFQQLVIRIKPALLNPPSLLIPPHQGIILPPLLSTLLLRWFVAGLQQDILAEG